MVDLQHCLFLTGYLLATIRLDMCVFKTIDFVSNHTGVGGINGVIDLYYDLRDINCL
jgi:hypothetical protein